MPHATRRTFTPRAARHPGSRLQVQQHHQEEDLPGGEQQEHGDAPPPTGCAKVHGVLRTLPPAWVVTMVNPKLTVFQSAAPALALASGVLTVMAFLVVLFVMVSQCNQICATTPVFQIDPSRSERGLGSLGAPSAWQVLLHMTA